MDYQKILKGIHQEIEPYATIGKQADYIPALAKINPDQFGMCIHTIQGETFMHGEATTGFSIQSISKVFSLAMCLSLEGDNLWKRVENDHFAATPCIIVFYFFILFNCSHIVATTEYFESTRRYCYPKCALAFLGFKSTKK